VRSSSKRLIYSNRKRKAENPYVRKKKKERNWCWRKFNSFCTSHDMNFSDEMRSIKSNFSLFVSRAIGVLFSEIKLILVDFWESS